MAEQNALLVAAILKRYMREKDRYLLCIIFEELTKDPRVSQ